MKAESFGDANRVLELGVGGDMFAVADQRIANRIEVVEKLLCVGVSVLRVRGLQAPHAVAHHGQVFLQPVVHVVKLAPVHLVLELIAAQIEGADAHGFVVAQAREEDFAGREPAARHGQDLRQMVGPADVLFENDLGLHAQRLARGIRGNERIAVAVAADPGAETNKAGHRNDGAAVFVFAIDVNHGALEVTIIGGNGLEQAALKIVQAHLDFVGDARFVRANLVGQPQQFDLQLQRVHQVVVFEGAEARIRQRVDDFEDLALVIHDGAAAGLGRVRGKHGLVEQAVEQCRQLIGFDALLVELLQRVEK